MQNMLPDFMKNKAMIQLSAAKRTERLWEEPEGAFIRRCSNH